MARTKGDPGAAKYQSTLKSFVQKKIAVAPKEQAEQIEAESPKPVKRKPKRPKAK
jgi:hypothetical protein